MFMPTFTRSYYIKKTLQADETYLREELPFPEDTFTTPRIPKKPIQEKETNMIYFGGLGNNNNGGIDPND